MGRNLTFGVVGLVIGLIVGFFVANNLNQVQTVPQDSAQDGRVEPNLNPQVPNITVKEEPNRTAMMPDIQETLDAAENKPKNFDAQIKAGELYFKIKNFDKAAEYYDRAESLKPDDIVSLTKLGNAYFDVKKFDKAGDLYQRILTKEPDSVAVLTDLGITYVERDKPDLDKAIAQFQKSLAVDPKHELTLYNLGVAYYKQGNISEAKSTLERLLQAKPQSELGSRLRQILE